MENFEQKLIDMVQQKLIKDIQKQELVKVDYGDRISVPKGFIEDVYASLDLEKIRKKLVENLENEMADRIANKMVTEFAGDIKSVLSNKEIREEMRQYVKARITEIANSVSE